MLWSWAGKMAVDFVSRKQQIFDQRREKIEGKTAITNYRRRSLVTTLTMTVVATEEAEGEGVRHILIADRERGKCENSFN